jgi:beta-aspartyl-peptidase (threonine type)
MHFLPVAMMLATSASWAIAQQGWDYESKNVSANVAHALPLTGRMQLVGEVLQIEKTQLDAWNRHDIQGYLSVYWNSPELVSKTDSDQIFGFEALAAQLVSSFGSKPETMGHVRMDDLKIKILAPDTACIVGSYVVNTAAHVDSGENTEILRRFPEGWRIVLETAHIRSN